MKVNRKNATYINIDLSEWLLESLGSVNKIILARAIASEMKYDAAVMYK